MTKPSKTTKSFVATVEIRSGKRVFAAGDAIEPGDLTEEAWAILTGNGRIVEGKPEPEPEPPAKPE